MRSNPKTTPAQRKRRMQTLERQIAKVKGELAELGDLRPGSLSEQYNVCGTPGCQCKADPPKKHGPYYQLSYSRKGKSSTRFVRPQHLATVKRQLKNYQRLRSAVDRWIDLATELATLRIENQEE
jgi:uncharacterized protein DUF6788